MLYLALLMLEFGIAILELGAWSFKIAILWGWAAVMWNAKVEIWILEFRMMNLKDCIFNA